MVHLRAQDITIVNKSDQVKDWSSLPTLLLWMIKDRLDHYNGIRLALVCKNWQYATISYPSQKKNEFNSPPWIMSYRGKITDNRRDFTSLLTEDRYKFHSPEFSGSEVLYSKQGWLLLLKKKLNKDGSMSDYVDPEYDSPYLLFNPFKNKKISLPSINENQLHGAFTIKDGNPHCVVLARSENAWIRYRPTIALYITYPTLDDSTVWLRYSYPCKKGEYLNTNSFFVRWVFIIGNLVYFITKEARVFIFDVTDLHWKDVMRSESAGKYLQNGEQYIVERQGELVRIHFPDAFGINIMDTDFWQNNMDRRDFDNKANYYKLKIVENNVYWELVDRRFFAPRCFWYLTKLFGHSFACDANDEHELAKLEKTFRSAMSFTVLSKSKWVHMG